MSLKTSLVIDLAGNLQSRARQFGKSLSGIGQTGQTAMRGLQSAAVNLGRGMDSLSGRYTAMIAGAGVAYKATQAIMTSAQLDKTLAKVTRTAGASREEAQGLREELFRMAQETGQPVEDLLQGFFGLVQAGQSWQEALGTIRAINPAMAVTGAKADVLASSMTVAAQAFKFDLSNAKTATLVLDQMTKAGDLGNAELEDLSSIFARVGNNAKTAGLSFEETLAFIERLSLVEKNPERLATLADSSLRLFTNQAYLKKASEITGVKFYDAKGERRAAFDVLADIRDKYKNFKTDTERDKAFASAFGATDLDTQRGLRIFLDGGTIEETRKMAAEVKSASGTVAEGLPDAIRNSVDQVSRLKAALGEAADEFARPINELISKGIKSMLDEHQIGGKEMLIGGGAAALTGYAGLKLAGQGLMRMGGGIAGSIAKGAGMGGLGGIKLPLPVYVVNKHMSLTRDAMMGKAGKDGKGGNAGNAGFPHGGSTAAGKGRGGGVPAPPSGNTAAKAAGAGAVVYNVIEAGRVVLNDEASLADKVEGLAVVGGQAAGGWAGASAGAAAGALIGSVVPILGTAIGAALGGVLGGIGGSMLGGMGMEKVAEYAKTAFDADKSESKQLQEGLRALGDTYQGAIYDSTIRIQVDGPATASISGDHSLGNLDLYSGTSFAAGLSD